MEQSNEHASGERENGSPERPHWPEVGHPEDDELDVETTESSGLMDVDVGPKDEVVSPLSPLRIYRPPGLYSPEGSDVEMSNTGVPRVEIQGASVNHHRVSSPSFGSMIFPVVPRSEQAALALNPFQNLQRHRVRNILLVASAYDSFCIEEDGILAEQISSIYLEFSLATSPHLHRASTLKEAFHEIRRRTYELIVVVTQFNDYDMWSTVSMILRMENPRNGRVPPVLPLCFSSLQVNVLEKSMRGKSRRVREPSTIFYYTGDASVFFSMIKLVEDRMNIVSDVSAGVRFILVVEKSPAKYSVLVPRVYQELFRAYLCCLPSDLNTLHRVRRMQSRPKILLATNYKTACNFIEKFSPSLITVLTTVNIDNQNDELGFRLQERYARYSSFLFISDDFEMEELTMRRKREKPGVSSFLHEDDPEFAQKLRIFLQDYVGFGDFVFRTPDDNSHGRARDLKEFAQMLSLVPSSSVRYHAGAMDFSHWFFVRGEFSLAYQTSRKHLSSFSETRDIIIFLRRCIASHNRFHGRGSIVDFTQSRLEMSQETQYFMKLGTGSLGGKARGSLFMDRLITNAQSMFGEEGSESRWPMVNFMTPRSVVLTTNIFDDFIVTNKLQYMQDPALDLSDDEIADVFVRAALPETVLTSLSQVLRTIRRPMAVRSSSLLEDSMRVAAAGIYETFFLTNVSPDLAARLRQLASAVKLVYASTFFEKSRKYLTSCNVNIAQEKMGVMIQEVVGDLHGKTDEYTGRWYPDISGVAQSYNFYALDNMRPEDGIGYVALGLGKAVVDKGMGFKFGLATPKVSYLFADADYLRESQREFYAIDMGLSSVEPTRFDTFSVSGFPLSEAESDGALKFVGSVFSKASGGMVDSIYGSPRENVRLVTFRPILVRSLYFPLAEVLNYLVSLAQQGVGGPAEIEFAINMRKKPIDFAILQLRPMMGAPPLTGENEDISDAEEQSDRFEAIVTSSLALGHGVLDGIEDFVYVKPQTFDRTRTFEIAKQFTEINKKLKAKDIPYVAVALGRWGTSEASLGIPIDFGDISGARVLIETGLPDYQIEPSFATHWIHNIMSLSIPFMYVHPTKDRFDFSYFDNLPAVEETEFLRHVQVEYPVRVIVSGKNRRGSILRRTQTSLSRSPSEFDLADPEQSGDGGHTRTRSA